MPHTLLARLAAASGAALLGATLLLAPLAAGAPRPHDRAQSTTMRLAAQQLWVRGPAGVHLRLNISSPLPASRLGIKVVLYSEVHTRDTFAETLGGNEPPSEVPIDSVPEGGTIPLAGILRNGKVSLRLPVTTGVASASSGGGSTTSPALGLDCSTNCSGVYPLQLVLFDTQQNVQLGSLTTYLVYVPPANGALRLRVGLVLPLGGVPAISPAGRSTLDASQLDQVQAIARRLAEAPVGTLSVDLYSQLLVALDRTPRGAAHGIVANLAIALGGSSPRQQMLGAPFVPVDPNALARENLGSELGAQLRLSTQIDSGELRHKTSAGPTVSTQDLGPAGLGLLEQFRTRQLVVPPTSLSATPPSGTTVSPYLLENDAGTPVGTVFASDAALSSRFDQPSKDPVLSAEQFLAELAVVYFEAPYASQARAVVIAPQTDGPSASFFAAALAGLTTSPVLQPATLSSLFTLWDGASSLPVTHLVATAGKGGDVAAGVVSSARKTLGVLGSVVPSAHAFVSRAAQAVLLGEAIGLSTKVRDDYEGAPVRSLQTVSRAVSLSANQTVTLTSRSGQIPVTVASQFPGPVNVVLQVSSSELTFPAGNRFPLRLTTRVHLEPVQVSTLTSGLTTMNVALLAPGSSGWVLGTKRLSIRSTAISAEAIGLSVGALLVLAAWWARSYARHRRREAAQRATRLGADPPPVA